MLDVLELLLEAALTRNEKLALQRANLRLELPRHLWGLAHELEAVSTRRYTHGANVLDELGRQRSREDPQHTNLQPRTRRASPWIPLMSLLASETVTFQEHASQPFQATEVNDYSLVLLALAADG